MKSAERRVVILDVLRGVAVLLVLARHMSPPDAGVASPLKAAGALGIQVGWIGVDLFFVLSGFLVSGLLFTEYLRHGSIDIVRFLVRRGFKIYPGFYVFIALTTVLLLVKGRFDASMAAALIAEVFYVQNYFGGMWNHTWSLAIEEHFYILLAVTLFLFVRTKPDLSTHERLRRFSTVVIVTGIMVAAGRALMPYVMLYTGGTQLDGTQLRIETHARIDTLAVGVLLSYLYHFHREKFMDTARAYRVPILGTSALLLTPPFVWPLGESHFTPSVASFRLRSGSERFL